MDDVPSKLPQLFYFRGAVLTVIFCEDSTQNKFTFHNLRLLTVYVVCQVIFHLSGKDQRSSKNVNLFFRLLPNNINNINNDTAAFVDNNNNNQAKANSVFYFEPAGQTVLV
jgi:hypothetical protein